ncbi:hypothetical protein [Thalassomonas actiniarum]|uniref:Uncharacterized protein n=1 Tax=Thalassomonas actiniarum TaxID=485447 RepID=A0AAF0C4Z7_9GAMM|nr:hypothetical protein [Thalassomonas actiniarum]WDE00571.1 hypothetical protein SG35_008025 [Thalassomonas actiniarum]
MAQDEKLIELVAGEIYVLFAEAVKASSSGWEAILHFQAAIGEVEERYGEELLYQALRFKSFLSDVDINTVIGMIQEGIAVTPQTRLN